MTGLLGFWLHHSPCSLGCWTNITLAPRSLSPKHQLHQLGFCKLCLCKRPQICKITNKKFTKQQLDVTTNIVCVSQYVNLYIYMCECRTLNTKRSKVGCHHNKPTTHDKYSKWCTRIQMCSVTPKGPKSTCDLFADFESNPELTLA